MDTTIIDRICETPRDKHFAKLIDINIHKIVYYYVFFSTFLFYKKNY